MPWAAFVATKRGPKHLKRNNPKRQVVLRDLRTGADTVDKAYDPDYERVRQFSLASRLRQAESLLLWSQVDLCGRRLTLTGKGHKEITLPISDAMHRILTDCVGHDKV